jgi:hypothetical protein
MHIFKKNKWLVVLVIVLVFVLVVIPGVFLAVMNNVYQTGKGDFFSISEVSRSQSVMPSFPFSADGDQYDSALPEETEGLQRMVIKTGSLSLIVKNIDQVFAEITSTVSRMGGFVERSDIRETVTGFRNGVVTVKIPSPRFEEAYTEIRALGIRVERESVDSRDVTDEYVDLEARLRNFKASEVRFLAILEKANTVEDILRVQRDLDKVRENIERLEGRLQLLNRQIEMSTISVSLTAQADVEIFGVVWSPAIAAKQSINNMLEGLIGYADFMIAALFLLPVALLWILTAGAVLFVIKLIRKKLVRSGTSPKEVSA